MNSKPPSEPRQWTSFTEGDAKVFEIFQADAASVFRRIDTGSGQAAISELLMLALALVAVSRPSTREVVFRPHPESLLGLALVVALILFISAGMYWIERTERWRFKVCDDTLHIDRYHGRRSGGAEILRFPYATIQRDAFGEFALYLGRKTPLRRRFWPSYIRIRYKGYVKRFAGHLSEDEIEAVYTAICEALGRPPDIRRAKINWSWVLSLGLGWLSLLTIVGTIAAVIFD